MTPLLFTSFLFSLLLVDLRYSALRAHYHADGQSQRLPRWLHRIVYRYRPYRYGDGPDGAGGDGHYHSNQRKLMRMEAEEAFELRGGVLVALVVVGLGMLWMVWRVVAGWGLMVARGWVS